MCGFFFACSRTSGVKVKELREKMPLRKKENPGMCQVRLETGKIPGVLRKPYGAEEEEEIQEIIVRKIIFGLKRRNINTCHLGQNRNSCLYKDKGSTTKLPH